MRCSKLCSNRAMQPRNTRTKGLVSLHSHLQELVMRYTAVSILLQGACARGGTRDAMQQVHEWPPHAAACAIP